MNSHLEGIVIIVGNYGSGKTEVAVNLALQKQRQGIDVQIADLDLVNPYFRTREARGMLTQEGVRVVLPPDRYLNADLPILSPTVAGMLGSRTGLMLLDVGGNDVGAIVLAALGDALKGRTCQMIQVINMYRPFTDTIDGCRKIREQIENASGLKMTGVVGNTNLLDETTPADIYKGYDLVREFSSETGLSLHFITVPVWLFPKIDKSRIECDVMPLNRQMVPPWKSPDKPIFSGP